MDTSIAPFRQVVTKLYLFKPLQVWEPLPGDCCSKALSRNNAPLKLPCFLVHTSNWGIVKHSRILTPWASIAHGLTLMTLSLREWEAFPTPRALTHTIIIWAFSPTAPQISGVTLEFFLCPWCFGHSWWRDAQHPNWRRWVHTYLQFQIVKQLSWQGIKVIFLTLTYKVVVISYWKQLVSSKLFIYVFFLCVENVYLKAVSFRIWWYDYSWGALQHLALQKYWGNQ